MSYRTECERTDKEISWTRCVDTLAVDPELEGLLPGLLPEELAALEASLLADGCRDHLTVWDNGGGVILDGHNRYRLCTRHQIPFRVRYIQLPDRQAAMDWIDKNQLARRNLTPDAFRLALGRRYNRSKSSRGGDHKSKCQSDTLIDTAAALASEHGVSEATVKRAGRFAEEVAAKPELAEAIRTGGNVKKAKRRMDARARATALKEASAAVSEARRVELASVCDIRVCSCKGLFASGIRPDVVITDPPYPARYLDCFDELAIACKGVPVVAVMSGQAHLPEVMARLCRHLKYRWTMAYMMPGGQSTQAQKAKVNVSWKPVILYGVATGWLGDVCRSGTNDNDKRFHSWGQSESGMADLVERLTRPGQLVCDPFCGGGTTAVVSLALGRRFVGCDIDCEAVATARQRVEVAG